MAIISQKTLQQVQELASNIERAYEHALVQAKNPYMDFENRFAYEDEANTLRSFIDSANTAVSALEQLCSRFDGHFGQMRKDHWVNSWVKDQGD